MKKFQTVFKRYEKKYIVTFEQAQNFLKLIEEYVVPDKYGKSTICNIYFDTPDFRLIRNSIEKPVFKEKLRIRSYGCPTAESNVFVELKRKYKGVIYKRRVDTPYIDAVNYLLKKRRPEGHNEQILNELDYFMSFYKKLQPAVSLFYDRIAFYSKDDKEIRITLDSNIRFRTKNFDLAKGSFGNSILEENKAIMEIKCLGAMPLWMSDALDELSVYPASFSKYGEAYKQIISPKETLSYAK